MSRLAATTRIMILTFLAATAPITLRSSEKRHRFFDIKVYFGAMHHWFRADGMVYDWVRPGTRYGFTYPPFAGLLMAPMAYLSLFAVILLTTAATVLATVFVLWSLTAPMIRRHGWPRWFAAAVIVCLGLAFEPVRETIGFGQINVLLLALVVGDMLYGVARGTRWAGVGIGLATAIKLTPGLFILYLIVTRRCRGAGTATGTLVGATAFAAVVAPGPSRVYWTVALWQTRRVGKLWITSNQSLRGLLARLDLGHATSYLWLLLVLLVLAYWVYRVRQASAAGDDHGALALTGLLGCLISPVTWIHHLVWIIPALVRCFDAGLSPTRRGRPRWPLYLAVIAYLTLTSRVWWTGGGHLWPPVQIFQVNIYVWFSLALLALMPICARTSPAGVPGSGTGPAAAGPPSPPAAG